MASKNTTPERVMVTLIDPDGKEFETGDAATINSLLVNGYSLKGGGSQAEAVEKVAANSPDATDAPGGK